MHFSNEKAVYRMHMLKCVCVFILSYNFVLACKSNYYKLQERGYCRNESVTCKSQVSNECEHFDSGMCFCLVLNVMLTVMLLVVMLLGLWDVVGGCLSSSGED